MLEKFAQEISEYLSSMMGRSIIITDINGIIIGAPAKERIGVFHPPSVPCIKYKKMSFDDEEAAKKLGVWYPGSTVPLFYNGRVIGTAAIAGDPAVVLQFTMLVKNQIESLLREKINSPMANSPQKKINELAAAICAFNYDTGDVETLRVRAGQLGIDLDLPRYVAAVFFSNFRGLGLDNNPVKISYKQYSDPIADEIDYSSMHRRVIEILREIFPDPQTVIASTGRDRFVILAASDANDMNDTVVHEETGMNIYNRLKTASIETIVGIGQPAQNIYELPMSYKNAWNIVKIAEKLGLPPRAYHYGHFIFEETLLSVKSPSSLKYVEKKLSALDTCEDAQYLKDTFTTYCECLFSKQAAAEKLHLHRNTLSYRLHKVEDKLDLDMADFRQMSLYYMALMLRRLGDEAGDVRG